MAEPSSSPWGLCPCGHPWIRHDIEEYRGDGSETCCVDGCTQGGCPGRTRRKDDMTEDVALADQIRRALNLASRENASNTPDHLLAAYLLAALEAAETLIRDREQWHGRPTGFAPRGAPPSTEETT